MWIYKTGTLLAVLLIIGLLCACLGGVLAFRMLPSSSGLQVVQSDKEAIARLDAMAKEAEQARAEAEALPKAIREQGIADERRIVASTDAYVRRVRADTYSMIALEAVRIRQQMCGFLWMLIAVVSLILTFVGPLALRERIARWLSG